MSGDDAVRIDHAVVGVRDLDAAVTRFESELGLLSLLRSEHPEWGTRNAVLAVGPGQFIELLESRGAQRATHPRTVPAGSALGRRE